MLKYYIFVIACFLFGCKQVETPKQTLRLNIFTEPPTLDSRKATDSTSINVLLNLFEGLTRIGAEHTPYPALAKNIAISEDKCTYVFTLRDAFWSNGERITAHDFLYAWQSILDPKFPALFAYKLYVIKNAAEIKAGKLPIQSLGARARDAKTLEVTLKHPTPYFLELTAFPTFFPVNKRICQKNSEWAAEAGADYVSNGPFQLQKWDHESEIIAVKNPNYWDARSVNLNVLHLAMIDDTTTEFYMFEMNELDWAGSPLSNLPPEFIPALKDEESNGNLHIHFYPSTAVYYYKINTLHPVLVNLNIRKALGYAINRKDIVEHVTQAGQKPAMALVPSMPGWEKESQLFEDGNSALAKQLFSKGLEELGLSQKDFPALSLIYNTNYEHQKIAQAIQQQWKEALGIEVELLHYDWKVYLSKISNQDYQIARMGWGDDFRDPISFLEPFKFKNDSNTSGNNNTGWENPQYIAYLDQAEREINLLKRAEYFRKAEELLISEMPIIPIYFIVSGYLKKPCVKGFYLSPLGTIDFKNAYIEK